MEEERMIRIEELKSRIARDDYVVDPQAIAAAIVERMLVRARGDIPPAARPARPRSEPRASLPLPGRSS
jgi:Anti-sigma-28 factor, FlgM